MNFAIVGCGFIAKKHANAINEIHSAKLVAICDKIPSAMDYYKQEYDATPYSDIEEMLKDNRIDIVCICTPSGFHASVAVQIAKSNKHIIIEKPIAMTIEDTNKIIEACDEYNVKLSVVHPNRFRPVVMKLKEILDDRLLGKISHANCIVNWNRGQEYYDQSPWRGTKEHDGGVLMNQAIHNLDLLLWFMGTPSQVFSMESTRFRRIEAEDVSIGNIKFKSGALASVQASTTVYPENFEESITIFGENGTVKIGGKNALYFEYINISGMTKNEIIELNDNIKSNPWGVPGHQRIIEDMIDSINEDKNPAITGKDGKNVLQLVLSMYESARLNIPIDY